MENAENQNLLAVVDSRLDGIQNCIESVAEDVASLSKVLIVGNGQPAMTVRMAVVERETGETRKDLDDLKASLEADRMAKGNRNWQGLFMLLSGLLSLITAIVTTWLKHP